MNAAALGQTAAAALGIAASPVSIATVIVLLLTPRGRAASLGFTLGWLFGIAGATGLFALVPSLIPQDVQDAAGRALAVVYVAVGAALLIFAAVQAVRRGAVGVEPAWVRAIDRTRPSIALAVGLAMAVNPPNLLLALAGGVGIASIAPDAGGIAPVLAVFTAVAASTVVAPAVVGLAANDSLRRPLAALRAWILGRAHFILAVVFGVMGAILVWQGLVAIGRA